MVCCLAALFGDCLFEGGQAAHEGLRLALDPGGRLGQGVAVNVIGIEDGQIDRGGLGGPARNEQESEHRQRQRWMPPGRVSCPCLHCNALNAW